MKPFKTHDVLIAGGGPAGNGAALLLGRCLHDIVLCDTGNGSCGSLPLPAITLELNAHGRCGFLKTSNQQLAKFPNALIARTGVIGVDRTAGGFHARCADGTGFHSRALLLAPDYFPKPPSLPGAENFAANSLHQCPYCDGWNHRGQQLGVLGGDRHAAELALKLLIWSNTVTLFTNGKEIGPAERENLTAKGIRIASGSVTSLRGDNGHLGTLILDDGSSHPCKALYFPSGQHPSHLAERLGCDMNPPRDPYHWKPDGGSGIPGLFVAGSPYRAADRPEIGAAEGILAAEAANQWLMEANRLLRESA